MDQRRYEDPETLPWRVPFTNAEGKEKTLAAFRDEKSYRAFLTLHGGSVHTILQYLLKNAREDTITMEMAGVEAEVIEMNGTTYYQELIDELEKTLQEAKVLQNHLHTYVIPVDGGPSYCSICTRPGDI